MITMEEMDAELLVCPFCGGRANLQSSYDDPSLSGCWVRCGTCRASVGMSEAFDSMENTCGDFNCWQDAADAWNRRSPAQEAPKTQP